jgi:hypothetical protein
MGKPNYNIRKFCDICDVFDEHETDECPLQESGDDGGGVQHHGDRNHERPYCGICEGKKYWSWYILKDDGLPRCILNWGSADFLW